MARARLIERLKAARAEVGQASALLISATPAAFAECTGPLEKACRTLAELRTGLAEAAGDPGVLAEARLLKSAVRVAQSLLGSAHQYHVRWNQTLGAMLGGYTLSGAPAPVFRAQRVCLTG